MSGVEPSGFTGHPHVPVGRGAADVEQLPGCGTDPGDAPDRLPPTSAPTIVPIAGLRVAGSPRLGGENLEHIRMMAGLDKRLPAIIVHRSSMRVIDGIHRLRAAELRGDREIEVRLFDGDEAEAFVLAVKANTTHGLPLSLADRVAAAERILATHPHWSDRTVAANTGLSATTVAGVRRRCTNDAAGSTARLGRDGKVRPTNGAAGRLRASELIAANPDAPLREIAKLAGISPATAMDVRARLRRGEGPAADGRAPDPNGSGPGKTAEPAAANQGNVVRGLQKDPSLRSNEMGRALLRILSLTLIDKNTREQLVACVPPYRAETVASAAAECAAVWREFAEQMKQRSKTIHTPAAQ